jgi:hypothetical protein
MQYHSNSPNCRFNAITQQSQTHRTRSILIIVRIYYDSSKHSL